MNRNSDAAETTLAAIWAARLTGHVDRATVREFEDWIRQSPGNAWKFMKVVADEKEKARLRTSGTASAPIAYKKRARLVAIPMGMAKRLTVVSLIVGLAVIAGLALLNRQQPQIDTQKVFAASASVLTVTLEDGSTMTLDAHSRFRVRYTAAGRDVTLDNGAATFHVARNPHRPFVVHFHGGDVRAVGTEFRVAEFAGETRVAVLMGKIRIQGASSGPPVDLVDRGTATVSARGLVLRVPEGLSANPDQSPQARSLAEIEAEFNANHPARPLVVSHEARAERVFVEVYPEDPERLILTLEAIGSFEVRREPARIVVRMKNKEAQGADGETAAQATNH